MAIRVEIVSAVGAIWSGDADVCIASAQMGEVGIVKGHAPLLTRLKPGDVVIKKADGDLNYFVSGGILEVQPEMVTILADTAIRAQDLDEALIRENRLKAEEALRNKKDKVDYALVEAQLAESLKQLHTIERYRTSTSTKLPPLQK